MATIGLRGVRKVFPGGSIALDQVDLDVADGELMVLVGPSGCGKSTLLRIIAGLEEPTAGTLYLDDEDATDFTPQQRQVAMVFQSFALYPHMTAADNIGFPLRVSGLPPEERHELVVESATALGVQELLERWPKQMSGGQRQRIAMGRALVRDPRILLLDEPLSNLDSGLRSELRAEISSTVRSSGITTVYVTHDQTEALTLADRIAVMRGGSIEDIGTPGRVYDKPATIFVAAFLGTPRINLFEAWVWNTVDSHVSLRIGEQTIALPWQDPRARQLAHYHGERVIVGVRAEALVSLAEPLPDCTIRGRVRYLEHHGHESLAFVDIGAAGIEIDLAPPPAAKPKHFRHRPVTTMRGVWKRITGTQPAEPEDQPDSTLPATAGRHQKRSSGLVMRLPPTVQVSAGDTLNIGVRRELLHFFDLRGDRIDAGFR
ncbi:ABC transporter ATP-binding protein [Kibdelosporangium aridum]|uniref:ABC transporter ATP-binding protein n=1 Tax=Kibdelosporangium aridum TaxID=2030 RepID=UPI0005268E38